MLFTASVSADSWDSGGGGVQFGSRGAWFCGQGGAPCLYKRSVSYPYTHLRIFTFDFGSFRVSYPSSTRTRGSSVAELVVLLASRLAAVSSCFTSKPRSAAVCASPVLRYTPRVLLK